MFGDDDFGLRDLRDVALGFPGAFEKISWGRPVFCVPKIFAMYGGNAKGESRGAMVPFPYSVLVKVDDTDRPALEQDGRAESAAQHQRYRSDQTQPDYR